MEAPPVLVAGMIPGATGKMIGDDTKGDWEISGNDSTYVPEKVWSDLIRTSFAWTTAQRVRSLHRKWRLEGLADGFAPILPKKEIGALPTSRVWTLGAAQDNEWNGRLGAKAVSSWLCSDGAPGRWTGSDWRDPRSTGSGHKRWLLDAWDSGLRPLSAEGCRAQRFWVEGSSPATLGAFEGRLGISSAQMPIGGRRAVPVGGSGCTPIPKRQGGRGITFRGSSSELLRALDLLGYLSVPGDLLDEIIPLELGTSAPSFSCALLGEGADFFLRREALPFGHAVALLAGGPLQVRLRPPESPVPSDALLGHRTAALSRVDLFHHDFAASAELEAELHEGDVLLIPPGWWHQPLALPSSGTHMPMTSKHQCDTHLPGHGAASSTTLVCDGLAGEGRHHHVRDIETPWAAAESRCVAFLACVDARWLVPRSEETSTGGDEFEELLRRQTSGQALPADADLWSKDELQSFIATGGFIQPRRRRLRTAAPQLREWLEIPLDQGDLSIPSEDAPKVIWMYWAQGSKQLNGFRRLCVHTWQVQNPDWKIKILEKETVARFIEPSELPRCYEELGRTRPERDAAGELPAAQQSDALRLALLAKYGGVYTDVATICLRPLEDAFGNTLQKEI
eukprot:g29619.t1